MMEKLMESERSESERPTEPMESEPLGSENPSDPNKSARAPATLDPAGGAAAKRRVLAAVHRQLDT